MIEKELPFETIKVDLSDKSPEFEAAYHAIHPDPSSTAKVPILIDTDGTSLIESQVVAEYIGQKYQSHGGTDFMSTDAPADLARAKLFIELFSTSVFAQGLFGTLRADSKQALEKAITALVEGLKVCDAALSMLGREDQSTGGSFFLGDRYSLAEVCTTGQLQRVLYVLPEVRKVDVWALIKQHKLERFERWARKALERPSAVATKPEVGVMVDSLKKYVVEIEEE